MCKTWSGTLPRNINGSSSFCKGPRTSKVWKSKDPQGPRTLRLCMSEDLCKHYYSHLYFAVVTFLTKIQNWCYNTQKNLSKHNCQKYLDGKNHYCPKNLDGKNHYHPRIFTTIQKVGSSRISISLSLLIRFWVLVRNVHSWHAVCCHKFDFTEFRQDIGIGPLASHGGPVSKRKLDIASLF